eukprot:TRINITY_DN26247_c0_g1_i1.p1 TRINITY_DN26247_c0_g1~~TRINITY_DN26247_c0_g1_i1.p1  ORF type:complete len:1446 (-),score=275.93 TRINITY_DN26247_c0_g1_i1:719-5056(-)
MAQGGIGYSDLDSLDGLDFLGRLDPNQGFPNDFFGSDTMDLSTESTLTPHQEGNAFQSGFLASSFVPSNGTQSNTPSSGASTASAQGQWQQSIFNTAMTNMASQQQLNSHIPHAEAAAPLSLEFELQKSGLLRALQMSEGMVRTLTTQCEQYRMEVMKLQGLNRQISAEKMAQEEKVKSAEALVRTMGQSALQQAMATLMGALDVAPIPRGIRFAPTDFEVFEYIARKLRGVQEEAGLDRFLVKRLRGLPDSPGLIPVVELLSFPRPWHLPGLDVSQDGVGRVGYYFVKPEWRPNERRRRRESNIIEGDMKPPCWKESCQPTFFDDLVQTYGSRPERRMFRFKLPGAREGPAGESKEKWKMYEYTLKSDAEMLEDHRNHFPSWVICKVVRDGPQTPAEEEESRRGAKQEPDNNSRGGGQGGGMFGDSNGGGGGGGDRFPGAGGGQGSGGEGSGAGRGGSPSNSNGSMSLNHSGAYSPGSGAYSQHGTGHSGAPQGAEVVPQGQAQDHTQGQLQGEKGGPGEGPGVGQQDAEEQQQQKQPQQGEQQPISSQELKAGSTPGAGGGSGAPGSRSGSGNSSSTADAAGATTKIWNNSIGSASRSPLGAPPRYEPGRDILEWLKASQQPPLPLREMRRQRGTGSKTGSTLSSSPPSGNRSSSESASPTISPSLPTVAETAVTVGQLFEDYFASKLAARADRPVCASMRKGRELTAGEWEALEKEDDEAGVPSTWQLETETGESHEEGKAEEAEEVDEVDEIGPVTRVAAEILAEVEDFKQVVSDAPVAKEVFARLADFLSQMATILREFKQHTARDGPSAQLWLESLQTALVPLHPMRDQLRRPAQSRILLLVKTPAMAQTAQGAVRRLAHILSLLPRVHLYSMSPSTRAQVARLRAAMQTAVISVEGPAADGLDKLQQVAKVGADIKPSFDSDDYLSPGDNSFGTPDEKSEKVTESGVTDDISELKALDSLKSFLMSLSGKGVEKGGLDQARIADVAPLLIQVFPLIGVEWDSSCVSTEIERLRTFSSETSEKGATSEASNGEGSHRYEAQMAEGLSVLLDACSLSQATDALPVDSDDSIPRASIKEGRQEIGVYQDESPRQSSASSLPSPPALVYTCPVFAENEVQSIPAVQGRHVGSIRDQMVTLEFLPRVPRPASFHREVELAFPIRHPNIIPLVGCNPEAGCFAYAYEPGRTLDELLYSSSSSSSGTSAVTPAAPATALPATSPSPLQWFVRLRIAFEIASAIDYLHSVTSPPILLQDLRSARVRLCPEAVTLFPGSNDNPSGLSGTPVKQRLVAKISSLGMAALIPPPEPGTIPVAQAMHLDPESVVSELLFVPASDVYALGVIIAQLLTGKQTTTAVRFVAGAYKPSKGPNPVEKGIAGSLDGTVGQWPFEEVDKVARVTAQCLSPRRADRPDLRTRLLPVLKKAAELALRTEAALEGGAFCE